jgi:hypothetical protein
MTPSRALWMRGLLVLTFCPGLRIASVDVLVPREARGYVHSRHGARSLGLGGTRRDLYKAHSAAEALRQQHTRRILTARHTGSYQRC